jgi:hypothetical protein
MTDGTVIAKDGSCSGDWYKLTPDNTGSYINGTWSQIASMQAGYGPLGFGSGVLPDGRVIVEGGEYNQQFDSRSNTVICEFSWTNQGAIYDPTTNVWTAVSPPSGWQKIGDAAGVVLDNGTYMQSNCCNYLQQPTPNALPAAALLNAKDLTWTSTGSGKYYDTNAGQYDDYDEEGFAKLPNGDVLDVDAYVDFNTNYCATNGCKNSEIYNATTGAWSSAGNTIDQEADTNNPGNAPSYEIGPVVLRQDGIAVIFPGLTCSDGFNANCQNSSNGYVIHPKADTYNSSTGVWSTFATMPTVGGYTYTMDDAPAAVLPDGNILIAASPSYGYAASPTHYFEVSLDGTMTQVGDTADAAIIPAQANNFLLLPTGQVLAIAGNIQIYTALVGSPPVQWRPILNKVPTCVTPGGTYVLSGLQLNGLTEGTYFGDDTQGATNFPIVKIVNKSTGHVFYAKTFGHSSRSIAFQAPVSTNFTVASTTELGKSILYDVGAGISSVGRPIKVGNSCPGATASSE